MNRSLTDGLEHLSGWSENADLQHLLVARGVKATACPPLPTFTWQVLQSPGQQKHWMVGPAPDACPRRRPEAKESPVDRKISIGQWNASSWITLNSAQVKHAYLVSAYCADAVVSIHTVCASWSKRSDEDLLLLACIVSIHSKMLLGSSQKYYSCHEEKEKGGVVLAAYMYVWWCMIE